MKGQFLISVLLLSTFLSLNAQIYTPGGTIQGSSGSNNVGIGTTSPVAKLHIESGPNTDAAVLATSSENNKLMVSSGSTQPVYASTFKITQQFDNNRNNGYISFHRGGSTEGGFLTFGTYGMERMRINPNGNVGIGSDPGSETFKIYKNELPSFVIASSISRLQIGMATCTGCYAVGARSGDAVLRTLGGNNSIILSIPNDNNDGNSFVGFSDSAHGLWMKIFNNKTVRIDGKVYSNEVIVKTDVWSDYVFESDHKLMPLKNLEDYIKTNKRLPDMPSAENVTKEGINIGEINALLLKKVEELTLYVLELNNKIEKLESGRQK